MFQLQVDIASRGAQLLRPGDDGLLDMLDRPG